MTDRAIVLLSGGLDSTTVLAKAHADGGELFALSFAYGQRHAVELDCARRQAVHFHVVRHEIIDLSALGRLVKGETALVAESEVSVPKNRDVESETDIPVTYVPARNTLFLSYALAWAEVLSVRRIYIGVNALDYSGYPDCRSEFIDAFEHMANLATKAGVGGQTLEIVTPLIDLRKHEIIALGRDLGVDYADTVSCYDPIVDSTGPLACGQCDSCQLRRAGFELAGVPDPTRYVDR